MKDEAIRRREGENGYEKIGEVKKKSRTGGESEKRRGRNERRSRSEMKERLCVSI